MSKQLPVLTDDAAGCCAPIAQLPLPAEHAARLARAYKALGDPVRLQLLSLIASHPGGEACVCDITAPFDLTGPTISHHLKVLREAGLILGERRGTWVYYRPVRAAITELSALLVLPEADPARA
ncbi:transcriptional regulator [Actinocatenispora thailandica]|uniref:Transcriptional regulator n=1 Tax=Actinocatenispora thailandica TaxID=227318 RepID=A0A7R7DVU4_9ACTN|nr:metalloregulator ArsR/SmtB family transcription factor [Actinocatenispora thailandica]BCJ38555.1 transcriptional regulator [Actinocatenispora thailandica]